MLETHITDKMKVKIEESRLILGRQYVIGNLAMFFML